MFFFVFFFKQKTAYEMRISDWSSDVCSSDLVEDGGVERRARPSAPVGLEADDLQHLVKVVPRGHGREPTGTAAWSPGEVAGYRGTLTDPRDGGRPRLRSDRKSTRLNSSD